MAPPAAVPRCPTPHAPTRRFVVPGIASGGRDRQISPPVDGTRDAFGPWPARLTWLLLPLVAGPALGDALNGTSRPVQVVSSVGLWVGWAAVVVATLVPTTVSLTALRVVAPAAVVAAGAALVAGTPRRPTRWASPARWPPASPRSGPAPARCSSTARRTATNGGCRCGCRARCWPGPSPWS